MRRVKQTRIARVNSETLLLDHQATPMSRPHARTCPQVDSISGRASARALTQPDTRTCGDSIGRNDGLRCDACVAFVVRLPIVSTRLQGATRHLSVAQHGKHTHTQTMATPAYAQYWYHCAQIRDSRGWVNHTFQKRCMVRIMYGKTVTCTESKTKMCRSRNMFNNCFCHTHNN